MMSFWWCVILAVGAIVAEDVVIQRIEPDPATQEFPCPHQIVQYKCQTLISTATLTWRLPSGDTLPFTGGSSVGRVRNSSDDQFSATLTGKMEDDDDHFFFTSTLLILEPINGSSLTCIASVSGSLSQRNTTIVLSGSPDSPTNVSYNELVVIVSSVELQWMRPSYTGSRGVSVMNYTVTANGGTVVVSDDSEVVSYTSPSLIYGDVLVTAVNSCGQKSSQSLLNIPTSEPCELTGQIIEIYCNEPLQNGRCVLVEWMVGPQEPGVVYPGEVEVSVELDPGDIACLIDEDSTSCTATIETDAVYQVTITQTNGVGTTTKNSLSFDPLPLDKDSGTIGSSLSVNITIQQLCKAENYTIVLCLGHKKASDEECDFTGGDRLEKENVQPGVPQVFNISNSTLTLSSGEVYCYTASLLSAGDKCDISSHSDSSFPAAGIAGIIVAVLIVLLLAVVTTVLLVWSLKKGSSASTVVPKSKKRNQVVPLPTDDSEDKYGPQTTTETADGSARSLRGCFQWFAEHFKRDNISRSGDTVQVSLATISGHVATHKPATQCPTFFPSQYSEIAASSLVEEDTAKIAQASLSPEKSTPADEELPFPSPVAGTAECGAGQKPQSTFHYAQMDFSKPPKMQPLPPPQLPQAMPSAQDYSEILMPIPAL